jgi:hypothetical protein
LGNGPIVKLPRGAVGTAGSRGRFRWGHTRSVSSGGTALGSTAAGGFARGMHIGYPVLARIAGLSWSVVKRGSGENPLL